MSPLTPLLALALLLLAPSARAQQGLFTTARVAAAEQGAGDESLLTREGTLEPGKALRTRVSLPAGTCVVAALALAQGDAELRLRPEGSEPLADRETGPIARVRYCAGQAAEKLGLVVVGVGAFALGVFPLAGEHPRAPAAPQEKLPAGLDVRLASLIERVAKDLVAMAPAREEDLSARDARRRDMVLEAGRCYRVLAVAEPEAGRMRVGFEGQPAVEDSAALSTPLTCVERTATHVLSLAVEGSGRVLWQLFGQADPGRAFVVGGEGDDFVARSLRSEHARDASGAAAGTAVVRGVMQTAGELEAAFEGEPGRCYAALAVGVPSVRALEVELYDQRGNLVARSSEGGNVSRARACADVRGAWKARVRVFKGYGSVGLQVFSGSS